VHVDVVGAPWPDAMEDAKDPSLFAAWSMGAFGPLAYPGGLRRAVQQAAAFPEAASDAHRAFVRLRTSYLVGAGEESAVLPDDWSALGELAALLRMASPLLALEGACAFFDPNAEVVLAPGAFRALMAESEGGEPSLELFTSVRHFVVDERWSLMDTVGMERFFLPDFEALIPTGTDPSEMAELLRDACAYLLSEGAVIEDLDQLRDLTTWLRTVGVRIALDDFGAGYTSFATLRALDLDYVKIDGAFVRRAPTDREDLAFVRALVELAKVRGVATVAEWIEDDATARLMRGLGVDALQGFLFGAPSSELPVPAG